MAKITFDDIGSEPLLTDFEMHTCSHPTVVVLDEELRKGRLDRLRSVAIAGHCCWISYLQFGTLNASKNAAS